MESTNLVAKILFELKVNKHWAVCVSEKRKRLYFYNIIEKKSYWEKPEFLSLTAEEEAKVKKYETENNFNENGLLENNGVKNIKRQNRIRVNKAIATNNFSMAQNVLEFNSNKDVSLKKTTHDPQSRIRVNRAIATSNFQTTQNLFEETVNGDISMKINRHEFTRPQNIRVNKIIATNNFQRTQNVFEKTNVSGNVPKATTRLRDIRSQNGIRVNKANATNNCKRLRIEFQNTGINRDVSRRMVRLEDKRPENTIRINKAIATNNFQTTQNAFQVANCSNNDVSFKINECEEIRLQNRTEFNTASATNSFPTTQNEFQEHINCEEIPIKKETNDSGHKEGNKYHFSPTSSRHDITELNSNVLSNLVTDIKEEKESEVSNKSILLNAKPFWSINNNKNEVKTLQTGKKRRKKKQCERQGYWINKSSLHAYKMLSSSVTSSYLETQEKNQMKTDNPFNLSHLNLLAFNIPEDKSGDRADLFRWMNDARNGDAKSVRNDTNSLQSKVVDSIFEKIGLSPNLLIVLDLVSLMMSFRLVVHHMSAPPSEFPAAFIVPYAVLTELDYLKNSNDLVESNLQRVRNVIKLVQESFSMKHPRLIGQTAEDSKILEDSSLNLDQHEDSIINCCIQYQKKGYPVVVFSADKDLLKRANEYNILCKTKKELAREIFILTTMKKTGLFDETQSVSRNFTNEVSNPVLSKLPSVLENPLQKYLSSILTDSMFKCYGPSLYLGRFLVKPPWNVRDICLNVIKHWIVMTDKMIDKKTMTCVHRIARLMHEQRSVKWTDAVAGELVDAVKHLITALNAYFPQETSVFAKEFQEIEDIFNSEMSRQKLEVQTTADALTTCPTAPQCDDQTMETIYEFIVTKLQSKLSEMNLFILQSNTVINYGMLQKTQYEEKRKELITYAAIVQNIYNGLLGMFNHKSVIIMPTLPFINQFLEGLQSMIILEAVPVTFQVTQHTVIEFYWKILHRNILFVEVNKFETLNRKFHEGMHKVNNIWQMDTT